MNNPITDYDNFILPVDDLNKAKAFYHYTLNLPVKFDFSDAGMTAFAVGKQESAIIVQEKNINKDIKPVILFVVENVTKTYEELKAKGVTFLSEPFAIPTGLMVQFEDPFGNRLGITDYSNNQK